MMMMAVGMSLRRLDKSLLGTVKKLEEIVRKACATPDTKQIFAVARFRRPLGAIWLDARPTSECAGGVVWPKINGFFFGRGVQRV